MRMLSVGVPFGQVLVQPPPYSREHSKHPLLCSDLLSEAANVVFDATHPSLICLVSVAAPSPASHFPFSSFVLYLEEILSCASLSFVSHLINSHGQGAVIGCLLMKIGKGSCFYWNNDHSVSVVSKVR